MEEFGLKYLKDSHRMESHRQASLTGHRVGSATASSRGKLSTLSTIVRKGEAEEWTQAE